MHEVTEGLLIAVLGAHLALLSFIAWQILHFGQYIRRVRRLVIAIVGMDCDELIDELMSVAEQRQGAGTGLADGGSTGSRPRREERRRPQEEERVQKHRERLATIAAGGQAWQYGLVVREQALTTDKLGALDNTEIEKMYARYDARLGAAMTKTLMSAALKLYAGMTSCFSRSRPRTSQGLSPISRATSLSDTRLEVLPASSTSATACSWPR